MSNATYDIMMWTVARIVLVLVTIILFGFIGAFAVGAYFF